jgi:hypothetical protein
MRDRLSAGLSTIFYDADRVAARREPRCDVTINRGCGTRRQAAREDEHLRYPLGQRIDRCEHFVDLLGLDSDAWKVDVGNLVARVVDDLDVDAGGGHGQSGRSTAPGGPGGHPGA